ncbi:MAG: hypothetical protein AAFQ99_12775, partial [Pseudomonadota bacterium]
MDEIDTSKSGSPDDPPQSVRQNATKVQPVQPAKSKDTFKPGDLVEFDKQLAIVRDRDGRLAGIEFITSGKEALVQSSRVAPIKSLLTRLKRAPADQFAAMAFDTAVKAAETEGKRKDEQALARRLCVILERPDALIAMDRVWPPLAVEVDSSSTIAHAVVRYYATDLVTSESRLLAYRPNQGIWAPPDQTVQRVVDSANGKWWFVREPARGRSSVRHFLGGSDEQRAVARAVETITSDDEWGLGAMSGVVFTNGFAMVTKAGIEIRPHAPEHRAQYS